MQGMARKALCVAGAAGLAALFAGLLLGVFRLTYAALEWLFESGVGEWLYSGHPWLGGVAPVWAVLAAAWSVWTIGHPAYKACCRHWARVNGEGGAK